MKKLVLALAAVAALGVGMLLVAGAGAQSTDVPGGTLLSRVAQKLGISESQLTTAVKDSRIDIINEKLAAGEITQEQADRMKQRLENSDVGFDFDHYKEGRCLAARFVIRATAQVLHIDAQQVLTQLQQGKSLAEIAQAQGTSVVDVRAALSNEVHSELQAKVDQGKITQAQADGKFQKFTTNEDKIVNYHPEPGEAAHCRGKHHRGNGEGENSATATPQA